MNATLNRKAFGKNLHLSTAFLIAVGLVDLVSTLAWLQIGGHEGNPAFARLWEIGPHAFILGKLAFLVGPIVILEIVRRERPASAEQGTWVAGLAYLALWLTQIFALSSTLQQMAS